MKQLILTCAFLAFSSAAGAQIAEPDFSGKDPHWIEDKNNLCWAADANPDKGESISWTGKCVNGLLSGFGQLTWYRKGLIRGQDVGTYQDGALTGHGRMTLEDGTRYDGDFPGEGTLIAPDGRLVRARSVPAGVAGWTIQSLEPIPERKD